MRNFSRALLAVTLALGGCGQMYQSPGSQPSTAPPTPTEGPPGATEPYAAPTTSPPPPSSVPPVASAPPSGLTSVQQTMLAEHNRDRAMHCAAPLTRSPQLEKVAQDWANSLRDRGCLFEHSRGEYGENLAAGTTGALPPEAVVAMWYDEVAKYRFPDGGFGMDTGHFTQLVWRSTTQVGCGMSQCKGMDIWVCNYNAAGNVEGEYPQEVLPKGCKR
jgi:uncharacterized protein YkwD